MPVDAHITHTHKSLHTILLMSDSSNTIHTNSKCTDSVCAVKTAEQKVIVAT